MKFLKKFLFGFIRFLIVLACIEVASFCLLIVLDGKICSLSDLGTARDAIVAYKLDPMELAGRDTGQERHTYLKGLFVHPYVGFCLSPRTQYRDIDQWLPQLFEWESKLQKDSFEKRTTFKRNEDSTFFVGITGGSVAGHFIERGQDALKEELSRCDQLKGKEIQIISLAVHGYKQPQQLMIMNYYLSLGGHLDMLINLDGFNEIALPIGENVRRNVNPFYPRAWYFLSQGMTDREALTAAGEMMLIIDRTKTLAHVTGKFPLDHSYTAALIWQLSVKNAGDKIIRIQNELGVGLEKESNYCLAEYLEQYSIIGADLEQVWKSSSNLMDTQCRSNGIHYYHFLQPNQYDPGSKILSEEERQTAISEGPFQEFVKLGYPGLREKGRELAEAGVQFHDMSMVFDHIPETLYTDTCCHFNRAGHEILGHAIGRVIVDDYCR